MIEEALVFAIETELKTLEPFEADPAALLPVFVYTLKESVLLLLTAVKIELVELDELDELEEVEVDEDWWLLLAVLLGGDGPAFLPRLSSICLKRSKKVRIFPVLFCLLLVSLLMHVPLSIVNPLAQTQPFSPSTRFNFLEQTLQLSPPLL